MSSDSAQAVIHIIKDVILQGFVPTVALCTMIFYVLWNNVKDRNSPESDTSAVEDLILNGKQNLLAFIHAKKVNLLILHGSNNSHSSRLAEIICDEAEKNNINPLMIEADEVDFNELPKLCEIDNFSLLVCTENLSDCTPPDTCSDMIAWINESKENTLPGIKFAVFGFDLNPENDKGNSVAEAVSKQLERIGGKKILDVGHTDCLEADLDTSFEDKEFLLWTENFILSFKKNTLPNEVKCDKESNVETLARCAMRNIPGEESEKHSDDAKIRKVLLITDETDVSIKLKKDLTKDGTTISVMNSEEINLDDSTFIKNVSTVIFCTPGRKDLPFISTSDDKKGSMNSMLECIKKEENIKFIIIGMNMDTNETQAVEERVVWISGNLWDELKESDEESKIPDDWMKKIVAHM